MLDAPGRSSSSPSSWWPPLDAPDGARLAARPGASWPGSREGVVSAEDQRLLAKSWSGDGDAVGRGRRRCSTSCATRSATYPARHDDEHQLDDTLPSEGGVDLQELTTAADREYAPTGRAWTPPTHRIEDDALRPRAGRRGPGPDADAVADGRPSRPRRHLDDRRRPGAVVVAGARPSRPRPAAGCARAARTLHEFHLSTNYRNSSEIYDYAAAYAERVGLDADLPDRGPLDRGRAAGA